MKIPAPHILSQFVDRTLEVAMFDKLLTSSNERIMCIHGPAGLGKSTLLSHMMEECQRRAIPWVYIEWEDSKRYNYLDIMREIRDGTEPSVFELFTDQVNGYTESGYELKIPIQGDIRDVEVSSSGEIKDSGVKVHVGHKIEIKDSMFNIQRPDLDVTETEVFVELTRRFKLCINALTSERERPLVIFLDALEKANEHTRRWIWGELLEGIRDQELSNLLVVLAGREPFNVEPSFFDCVEEYKLQLFKLDHINEYLAKRGLEAKKDWADLILSNTERGNPLEVAKFINNFLRYQKQKQANESA